jgi:hypothetical protein
VSPLAASRTHVTQDARSRDVPPGNSARRRTQILFIACAAIGVVALGMVASRPARQPLPVSERSDVEQRPSRSEALAVSSLEREADAAVVGSVGLAEMSDRFRNAALGSAIRDEGFVCEVVTDAILSASDVWIASCSNMIRYRVDVTESNELVAQPVASYFDQLNPVVQPLNDGLRIDRDAPLRVPPPFPTK